MLYYPPSQPICRHRDLAQPPRVLAAKTHTIRSFGRVQRWWFGSLRYFARSHMVVSWLQVSEDDERQEDGNENGRNDGELRRRAVASSRGRRSWACPLHLNRPPSLSSPHRLYVSTLTPFRFIFTLTLGLICLLVFLNLI